MPRSIDTIHFVPSYLSSERHVEFVTLRTVTLYYFKLKAPSFIADAVG